MTTPDDRNVLPRYFELLDSRQLVELLDMFAPDGTMITKGGTSGAVLRGTDALRAFYAARGPASASHVITAHAQSGTTSFAEGLVRSHTGGPLKFFLASATLNSHGQILRYTTLVWDALSDEQADALSGSTTRAT